MKALILFLLLVALSNASIIYIPSDYPALFRDAELVAIVRITDIKDTGKTKELIRASSEPSRLLFREFKATLTIVSLLKGKAAESVECTLYRYPTVKECINDFGKEEGLTRLAVGFRAGNEVHVLRSLPKDTKDYLVYFSRSADGSYIPVTGDSASSRAICQLIPP